MARTCCDDHARRKPNRHVLHQVGPPKTLGHKEKRALARSSVRTHLRQLECTVSRLQLLL